MNIGTKTTKKRFYLQTTDIFQGLAIFPMIIGHAGHWWDHSLAYQWPNLQPLSNIIIAVGFLVFPTFLFMYSFNTTNSLLRKEDVSSRREVRIRLVKRSVIFALFGFLAQLIQALLSRDKFLNWLLTWHLFYMFALSTLFIFLLFEFIWWIEKQTRQDVCTIAFFLSLTFVIGLFLLLHDYSVTVHVTEPVMLNINSILSNIFIDFGFCPILPWLSFSLAGGLTASFLDLPRASKKTILKKARFVLLGSILFIIIGWFFLSIERWVSTPVLYPASSSFVFSAIGLLVFFTTIMILLIDLDQMFSRKSINKLLLPFILLCKISLTVFIIHNIAFVINPALQLGNIRVFPDETSVIVAGTLYSLFFVLVAIIWQKWQFKYSLEWMIYKLQSAQWRWWVRKPTEITV